MDKVDKVKLIQLSNLPSLLSLVVGYPINIDKIEVGQNGHISFESNDLTDMTGIMKPYYERFTVSSFSNGFTEDPNIYWVSVNFSFTYKTGGSNGTKITDVLYDFNENKWKLIFN